MSEEIRNIHTYDQPIETSIKVGIEIDSKGQRKPAIEIKITRKLHNTSDPVLHIEDDLKSSLLRCRDTLKKAMEE